MIGDLAKMGFKLVTIIDPELRTIKIAVVAMAAKGCS